MTKETETCSIHAGRLAVIESKLESFESDIAVLKEKAEKTLVTLTKVEVLMNGKSWVTPTAIAGVSGIGGWALLDHFAPLIAKLLGG